MNPKQETKANRLVRRQNKGKNFRKQPQKSFSGDAYSPQPVHTSIRDNFQPVKSSENWINKYNNTKVSDC